MFWRFTDGTFLCWTLDFYCQYCSDCSCFSPYLLRLCLQRSSVSRFFHFENFLLCDNVGCWPSTDRNMDVFLLIRLSSSQPHISAEGSFKPLHEWVLRGFLCTASKHLDDATPINMPPSIHIHCWDSESRLHTCSRTSPVALDSCRHSLWCVL